MSGFDTYLGPPHAGSSPYGRNNDPEKVFTVAGGQLHISGKVFGGLLTENSHENYHLTVEYKWGEKKWPPREICHVAAGIVLHASGTPGDLHGWSIPGITCEISEIDNGALNVSSGLAKSISLSSHVEKVPMKKADRFQYVYKPGATTHDSAIRVDPRPWSSAGPGQGCAGQGLRAWGCTSRRRVEQAGVHLRRRPHHGHPERNHD